MRTLSLTATIAAVAISLSACGTAPASREPVPVQPGETFKGKHIDVRAPQSPGWLVVKNSGAGMLFLRRGSGKDETYSAFVHFGRSQVPQSDEDFMADIIRQIDQDNSNGRFDYIRLDRAVHRDRGYLCIELNSLAKDKRAVTRDGGTRTLLFTLRNLYCRHPGLEDKVFTVSYSHRGEQTDPDFATDAAAFIDGVQVPRR